MIDVFQQISRITDPEKIVEMNFNLPCALPIHFHCKDLDGKYIGCNDRVMQDAGLNNKADFLGRTDFDFDCLDDNEAQSFRNIDKFVLATEKTHFFIQSVTLADQKKYIAMNHKTPLHSPSNKIIGVISFGIITQQLPSPILDSEYPAFNLLFSNNPGLLQRLSERQIECLYFLVRGLSIKDIAKRLSLSSRTVEHYLECIKIKMNCNSRSELVDRVLKTHV